MSFVFPASPCYERLAVELFLCDVRGAYSYEYRASASGGNSRARCSPSRHKELPLSRLCRFSLLWAERRRKWELHMIPPDCNLNKTIVIVFSLAHQLRKKKKKKNNFRIASIDRRQPGQTVSKRDDRSATNARHKYPTLGLLCIASRSDRYGTTTG
jgi:hypothetical protein